MHILSSWVHQLPSILGQRFQFNNDSLFVHQRTRHVVHPGNFTISRGAQHQLQGKQKKKRKVRGYSEEARKDEDAERTSIFMASITTSA